MQQIDPSQPFDFDKINQAMFEYLRALNITQEDFIGVAEFGPLTSTGDSFECASSGIGIGGGGSGIDLELGQGSGGSRPGFANRDVLALQQQIKRRKEEKLNYLLTHRWDPKWLRSTRTSCCIPFAIVALILLVFTNLSSNWVRLDSNYFLYKKY